MFARKVAARLKPNSLAEFRRLMECEILPQLRRQQGFLHLMILAVRDGSEVATISFWDHEGDVQLYNPSGDPDWLNILDRILAGPPYVKTFDVIGATFHQALVSPEVDGLGQDNVSSLTRIFDWAHSVSNYM